MGMMVYSLLAGNAGFIASTAGGQSSRRAHDLAREGPVESYFGLGRGVRSLGFLQEVRYRGSISY